MKIKIPRRSIAIVITAAFLVTGAAVVFSASDTQSIAMIMKIIKDDVQKKTPASDWQKAKRGDRLASRDNLRTGAAAFAIVKFNDNTLLKVRPNSEVTITGEVVSNTFSKNVEINRGGTDFDVQKQEKEKFEFTTPTSVASIRGTNGRFSSDKDSSDYLFINTGLATLMNLISHQSTDVGGGQVGISYRDGKIEVRIMTQDEQQDMKETSELRQGGDNELQELEMNFRDNQGQDHKLKIEVKKK